MSRTSISISRRTSWRWRKGTSCLLTSNCTTLRWLCKCLLLQVCKSWVNKLCRLHRDTTSMKSRTSCTTKYSCSNKMQTRWWKRCSKWKGSSFNVLRLLWQVCCLITLSRSTGHTQQACVFTGQTSTWLWEPNSLKANWLLAACSSLSCWTTKSKIH